jgi:hypothetical protein
MSTSARRPFSALLLWFPGFGIFLASELLHALHALNSFTKLAGVVAECLGISTLASWVASSSSPLEAMELLAQAEQARSLA